MESDHSHVEKYVIVLTNVDTSEKKLTDLLSE